MTDEPVKVDLKGVVKDTDRHGNDRYYFRVPGRRKVRLREPIGSDEFLEELRCARAGVAYVRPGTLPNVRSVSKPSEPAKKGTLLWLCQEYYRRGGAEITEDTMARRRAILERVCELPHPLEGDRDPQYPTKGSLPFAGMKRSHVKEIRDTRLDALGAANNMVKAISAMFEWAKEAELVDSNPARGIKRLKSGDGWHTWEVSEIVRYEKRHVRGTTARRALAIFMFTGLRLSDVAIFGRQHITLVHNDETGEWEKWIRIKPGKTSRNSESVMVELPLLPELEEELNATPVDQMIFLVNEYGSPFSGNGLGNKMRQWCDEAGLPHCSAHGLRKAGATIAAENGATHEQLKAIYGWTTYQQPDLYIRKARRRKVAKAARHLLVIDRNENKIVPLSEGVDLSGTNSARKSLKIKEPR
ncbi:tyrosine-type recombinase/integrase [Allomesorhizobium camelthorni]|uniref:tyrosine-type recombinase/integrase n=1 Tax=Allomesorhizobium camelthorni TaxID=475069 RepID=UPI001FE92B29|nr:tyrosine-type recombinase/integrase [Mesorhizobium camelthorni]